MIIPYRCFIAQQMVQLTSGMIQKKDTVKAQQHFLTTGALLITC